MPNLETQPVLSGFEPLPASIDTTVDLHTINHVPSISERIHELEDDTQPRLVGYAALELSLLQQHELFASYGPMH